MCDQQPLQTEPLLNTASECSSPLPGLCQGALFTQPSLLPLSLKVLPGCSPAGEAGSSRGNVELFTHPSCLPCQPRRLSLVWVWMEPSAPCLAAPGRQRAGLAAMASLSTARAARAGQSWLGALPAGRGVEGGWSPSTRTGLEHGTRMRASSSRELRPSDPTSPRPLKDSADAYKRRW